MNGFGVSVLLDCDKYLMPSRWLSNFTHFQSIERCALRKFSSKTDGTPQVVKEDDDEVSTVYARNPTASVSSQGHCSENSAIYIGS